LNYLKYCPHSLSFTPLWMNKSRMRFFFRKKIISLIICYIIAVTSAGLLDNEIWGKRIKKGRRKNIFKQKFDVRAGEKLLKTSQFFLSTETGAVAGLFISTEKIAFCSQRSISFNIPNWQHNDTVEQVNILFIIFFMSLLGRVLFNWLYIPINMLVFFFWESSVMDVVLQWSLIYFSFEKIELIFIFEKWSWILIATGQFALHMTIPYMLNWIVRSLILKFIICLIDRWKMLQILKFNILVLLFGTVNYVPSNTDMLLTVVVCNYVGTIGPCHSLLLT
jgi:hypothetical protein